jgi:two-component system sensor kinase FixL
MTAMMGRPWPAGVRRDGLAYLAALIALIACLAVRVAATPLLGDRSGLVVLVPAVILGAALGGFGPALFVVVVGLLATEVIAGAAVFTLPANIVGAMVFLVFGIASGLAGDRLRRGRSEQREAVARMKALLDTVPDAMFVFDVQCRLHAFSASAVVLFGWSEQEITGRPVWELFSEASRDTIGACMRAVEGDGQEACFGRGRLMQGRRRDGALFPIEVSVCRTGSTGQQMFTGFARDLTDRFQEQQRFQALEADLMHLARLNAMGQVATTLAHELNQPLAAATNFMAASARLLDQPSPDLPVVTNALRSCVSQMTRAGDIIQRMRAFIAKREPARAREDLAEVVIEAVTLAMAGAHDISLSYEIEPALEPVVLDRVQIQQVVVNLVRNARDAMAGIESPAIAISVGRAGDLMLVSVADTGPGVAPDLAPRILDPFVTSKPQGLGVGLSISHGIVESHGGTLWLEPRRGPGAVFKFTVSAVTPEPQADAF